MLLKGVNKRVIVIKNPGSEIFEEAYFILKSGGIKSIFKQSVENEMVIEANRIIADYHSQQRRIIEKNGIASSIGGELTDFDAFLNSTASETAKKENIGNTQKLSGLNAGSFKTENFSNTPEFAGYREKTPRKSAFSFISAKKIRFKNLSVPAPPKSFFVGVGFMSAVIILVRIIEVIFFR